MSFQQTIRTRILQNEFQRGYQPRINFMKDENGDLLADETLWSEIHKLSTWNKEEQSDQWKDSITVPIHKKGDKTDK
jgi:hypothetical protein